MLTLACRVQVSNKPTVPRATGHNEAMDPLLRCKAAIAHRHTVGPRRCLPVVIDFVKFGNGTKMGGASHVLELICVSKGIPVGRRSIDGQGHDMCGLPLPVLPPAPSLFLPLLTGAAKSERWEEREKQKVLSLKNACKSSSSFFLHQTCIILLHVM